MHLNGFRGIRVIHQIRAYDLLLIRDLLHHVGGQRTAEGRLHDIRQAFIFYIPMIAIPGKNTLIHQRHRSCRRVNALRWNTEEIKYLPGFDTEGLTLQTIKFGARWLVALNPGRKVVDLLRAGHGQVDHF